VRPFKKRKNQAETAVVDEKVFYSTPFGDTNDGRQQPFLLHRGGIPYVPVFRSVDSMKSFYERMNRAAYVILEADVNSVMRTIRSIDMLASAGIVIEPLSEHPVEIRPAP
jgi:hypothetical protein